MPVEMDKYSNGGHMPVYNYIYCTVDKLPVKEGYGGGYIPVYIEILKLAYGNIMVRAPMGYTREKLSCGIILVSAPMNSAREMNNMIVYVTIYICENEHENRLTVLR